MNHRRARGFTLIEVMVALMVIAMGLAALMMAVSGTARTSSYLRDKTLAQWIALNRLSEVRLNLAKPGTNTNTNTDTGELDFANRTWHYDTRYFDTSIATMRRVVVRVYAGDAKTKGNPVAESTGFLGTALNPPGTSNTVADWTPPVGPATTNGAPGVAGAHTTPASGLVTPANPSLPTGGTTPTPAPTP